MPIILPGSMTLGPRPSAGPSTLVSQFTAWGLGWYGDWLASVGLTLLSDGTGGFPTEGGAWGLWTPQTQLAFNHSFQQTNVALRPTYSASQGGAAAVAGNGLTSFANLSSTSALNQSFTLLLSAWMTVETATLVSANIRNFAMESISTSGDQYYVGNSLSTGAQSARAIRSELSGGKLRVRWGVTTEGTLHYNNALNLFRRSNGATYSTGWINQISLCPALTASQLRTAIGLLV